MIRTEEEIKAELIRIEAIRTQNTEEVVKIGTYPLAIHTLLLIEKQARIAALKWVLGGERS